MTPSRLTPTFCITDRKYHVIASLRFDCVRCAFSAMREDEAMT